MAKRLLIFLLIGIVGAFSPSICSAAEPVKNVHITHELTGTVILLDRTRIHVLYESINNRHFVANFRITQVTQINGKIEMGALVKVTFRRMGNDSDLIRRVALSIELIQAPDPESVEAGQ
jgi:hypothetical protein